MFVGLVRVTFDFLCEMFFRWCGAEVWRGGQLMCRPRDLTGIQNCEARPEIAFVVLQNGTILNVIGELTYPTSMEKYCGRVLCTVSYRTQNWAII
ncbi:hypothetical protein AVEN_244923-1 [Araneus ventricosus]|uniref:Uncharacterized protein n=1 Tax=Araneus ventricosus TaxID=182803 RepID=A0A4Y2R0H5_ARAVE|nr:hypothetical protein AVEN_244923-1 [Araneus ventricosus]